MKQDTYFWSCHITKDKLKELGAVDILAARFIYSGLQPQPSDDNMEWIYRAEPSFITLVKFSCNADIVEVPYKHHRAISRGRFPKIGYTSKLCDQLGYLKWKMVSGHGTDK